MGKLKTTEQIDEELQIFKEKKLRRKELEKNRKLKALKELYKKVNKSLQKEKKERADKLIEELKIIAPKPLKEEKTDFHINIYNNNLIEAFPNEDDLYKSWEEIEADETGKLNPNYRYFIEKVKNEIHNLFKN